ncbi:S-adenosylmethionine-binding protein [Salmonella enterica]|nr:S-adenosylmethionine-binding protein [Salmonella enterica]ECB1886163.1 S-adenosylmethionine-binding protein [Salmonella enterica subsp. enterica serovar Mississippi]
MDAPKYRLIYADPAWEYKDKAKDGKRGVDYKYPTMKLEDICRLPVWTIADPVSCLLAMWWVPTQVEEALAVMKAWGFRLMTMKGFTWHKTNRVKGGSAMGMGHMTRANSEDVLFAVRGKLPARVDASIIQHITAPRGEHSAKPVEVRQGLERLLGDVPRIELFSRSNAEGWHHWGNQAPNNDIEFVPARAVRPFDWKDPKSPWNPNNNLTHWQGISPAFAITEKKVMDDFCNEYGPIDGQQRTCPRCGELTRLEYHTCVIPRSE